MVFAEGRAPACAHLVGHVSKQQQQHKRERVSVSQQNARAVRELRPVDGAKGEGRDER